LVEDLGEEAFPEPKDAAAAAATASVSDAQSVTSSDTSSTSTLIDDDSTPPTPSTTTSSPESDTTKTVESQEPLPNLEQAAEEVLHQRHDQTIVTTSERKPMAIPESVHVRISPENLKEYVGPPVYQKDRLYVTPPPPGVSTGLGYLGNGSGAVMPVEAMVRSICMLITPDI
jgi:Lon-like ATP-dependent protease